MSADLSAKGAETVAASAQITELQRKLVEAQDARGAEEASPKPAFVEVSQNALAAEGTYPVLCGLIMSRERISQMPRLVSLHLNSFLVPPLVDSLSV